MVPRAYQKKWLATRLTCATVVPILGFILREAPYDSFVKFINTLKLVATSQL